MKYKISIGFVVLIVIVSFYFFFPFNNAHAPAISTDKSDLIRVDSPLPNQTVSSPLKISGVARGYWFFEASFPVRLYDGSGEKVASGIAQAKDEWMTTDFVPFEVTLIFASSTPGLGSIVLSKDNPSGLPENEDTLIIPVNF